MSADEFITAAVQGIVIDSGLAQLARWVFLISEAEVDCDKDIATKMESTLSSTAAARGLTDLGCAYESIGAAQLAAPARRVANSTPSANDVDLERMNELVCARAGYDHSSIRALVEGQITGKI